MTNELKLTKRPKKKKKKNSDSRIRFVADDQQQQLACMFRMLERQDELIMRSNRSVKNTQVC